MGSKVYVEVGVLRRHPSSPQSPNLVYTAPNMRISHCGQRSEFYSLAVAIFVCLCGQKMETARVSNVAKILHSVRPPSTKHTSRLQVNAVRNSYYKRKMHLLCDKRIWPTRHGRSPAQLSRLHLLLWTRALSLAQPGNRLLARDLQLTERARVPTHQTRPPRRRR